MERDPWFMFEIIFVPWRIRWRVNVRIRIVKHKLILEMSPRIPCESGEENIANQKATQTQVLNKYYVFEIYLLSTLYK